MPAERVADALRVAHAELHRYFACFEAERHRIQPARNRDHVRGRLPGSDLALAELKCQSVGTLERRKFEIRQTALLNSAFSADVAPTLECA